jgi:hypothetical protein
MSKIIIITVFLNLLSSCFTHAQNDTSKTEEITIMTYGLPGPDEYEYHKIAKKYHYKLVTVGGCIVSDSLIDAVRKHNKIAYEKLDKINGNNWQEQYEKDVQSAYTRDSTIIEFVKKQKFIREQNAIEKKYGNGLQFIVDTELPSNIYRVNVMGYLDSTSQFVSFYRVFVKFDNLTIVDKEANIIHDILK